MTENTHWGKADLATEGIWQRTVLLAWHYSPCPAAVRALLKSSFVWTFESFICGKHIFFDSPFFIVQKELEQIVWDFT